MGAFADDILDSDDIRSEPVFVEQWQKTIYIREMTGAERQQFLQLVQKSNQTANAEAWLIAMVACDEKGEKIFTLDQVDRLLTKNAKALDKLGKKILEMNKIGGEEVVEAEAKNSKPSLSVASASA